MLKRAIFGESFVIISFVGVLIRLGGLPPYLPTRQLAPLPAFTSVQASKTRLGGPLISCLHLQCFFGSRIDRSASSQLTRLLVRVVGSHRIDSTRQNSSPKH